MDKLRELLPDNLFQAMLRKLGREETLRLLWGVLVGEQLASQTGLKSVRGTTLVVTVPDAQWTRSLQPMGKMLVDAVNRFPDSWRAKSVEFVVDLNPNAAVPKPAARGGSGRAGLRATSESNGLAGGSIGDEQLREAFSESEHKYFSRREEPAK